MAEKFHSIDELLAFELHDLYSAEEQLVEAFTHLHKAAHHPEVKKAFHDDLKESEASKIQLDKVFALMHTQHSKTVCKAMVGLVKECMDTIESKAADNIHDAALIGAALRFEHYEMAGYSVCQVLATQLGKDDVAKMMGAKLKEIDSDVAGYHKLLNVLVPMTNETHSSDSKANSNGTHDTNGVPEPKHAKM